MANSDQAIRDIVAQLAGSNPAPVQPQMAGLMTTPIPARSNFAMMPVADQMIERARGQLASQRASQRERVGRDAGPIVGDVNAALPEAYQDPNRGLGASIKNAATRLMVLPQHALGNSQFSLDTGNYDPGPTLQAATIPIGTGAIASVPIKGTVGSARYADDVIDMLAQAIQSPSSQTRSTKN